MFIARWQAAGDAVTQKVQNVKLPFFSFFLSFLSFFFFSSLFFSWRYNPRWGLYFTAL